MRIAVISDQHFGFDWNGDRADDPFRNCREAFEKARDADLILLPGDLFDKKVPKQEVLGRAIDLFNCFDGETSSVQLDSDRSDKTVSFRGPPIVAIHGTHERRTSDHLNPVELLEKMGYLVHIHNETLVFSEGDETVAIHGMSGVPERYAPQVLDRFDPEPVADAYNILMLHQSIDQLVYTDPDHDTLSLERLPEGFDTIIDGHIHWRNLELKDDDKPVVLPGSTVTTQLNKIEAEREKGMVWIDTETGLSFDALEEPRDVVYIEEDVSDLSSSEIQEQIENEIDERSTMDQRRPLVRVKLSGTTNAAVSVGELETALESKALISISDETTIPNEDTDDSTFDHSEESVYEHGTALLEERIDQPAIDDLVTHLADGNVETARSMLETMVTEHDEETGDSDTTEKPGSTLKSFVDTDD